MDGQQYSTSIQNLANENAILDVKPLKTLSPMFPATYGLNSFSQSSSLPFVYIAPSDYKSLPGGFAPPFPCPASHPGDTNLMLATPVYNGPRSNLSSNGAPSFHTPPANVISVDDEDEASHGGRTAASDKKIKKLGHFSVYQVGSNSVTDGSTGGLVQKKKLKKVQIDSGLVPSLLDPRDSVEIVLMTFDALRRWLVQKEDGKDVKNSRPDLTSGTTLMTNDLRANRGKRIGLVPGVEIGDIFYFRMELCLVGLHTPSMGGIDYMTAQFNDGDDTVAVSVVSAGVYENEETDADTLIYSGQGGNTNVDQKLERGNLALERSLHRGNMVRVIRSARDYSTPNGKIYFYDGLYKVRRSWVEKGKSGFNVFKFKLLREPEQSPGLAIWKMTQQWKDVPTSRGRTILPDISSGAENTPVCLVNEVDDDKGLSHFRYSTKVEYLRPVSAMKPLELCRCASVCLPGDNNCPCTKPNGGNLPYSSTGTLVSRKPLLYECNASCCCTPTCRNRISQKGVKLQFEVFKTKNRGWGLRSWDPVRAGTFICEYTGEIINKINLEDGSAEDDEYIFQTNGTDEKAFKWNYGPELYGESSADYSSESLGPLPIVISSKNVGNISRFMNHSCSPNVFWQPVLYDHGDEGYPHIMFFAMKHIPPLMELTYDYGASSGSSSRNTKKCLCGSPKCRGLFG